MATKLLCTVQNLARPSSSSSSVSSSSFSTIFTQTASATHLPIIPAAAAASASPNAFSSASEHSSTGWSNGKIVGVSLAATAGILLVAVGLPFLALFCWRRRHRYLLPSPQPRPPSVGPFKPSLDSDRPSVAEPKPTLEPDMERGSVQGIKSVVITPDLVQHVHSHRQDQDQDLDQAQDQAQDHSHLPHQDLSPIPSLQAVDSPSPGWTPVPARQPMTSYGGVGRTAPRIITAHLPGSAQRKLGYAPSVMSTDTTFTSVRRASVRLAHAVHLTIAPVHHVSATDPNPFEDPPVLSAADTSPYYTPTASTPDSVMYSESMRSWKRASGQSHWSRRTHAAMARVMHSLRPGASTADLRSAVGSAVAHPHAHPGLDQDTTVTLGLARQPSRPQLRIVTEFPARR